MSQILLEKFMSLFFNALRKLQVLRPANLLKRDFSTVFSFETGKIFNSSFSTEHLRWVVLKTTNSNILFKDFSGIPPLQGYAQLISYNLKLSQWQTTFKNAFTYQKLVPIERFCNRFRTNSKGSDLNINNFAVLSHFRIT